MLFLISPAKTLDETTPIPYSPSPKQHQPFFTDQALVLAQHAQQLSPIDLEQLMQVSEKIALLTAARFSAFAPPFAEHNAKPAVFLFKGHVYGGLDAYHLPQAAQQYLEEHLYILSGLYGLLNAFDWIQPYRLEMGTTLKNIRGHDLYAFWHTLIAERISTLLMQHRHKLVINLASQEYYKVVASKQWQIPVITPVFQERKQGRYRVIAIHAKRARGLMVKFASLQNIQTPEDLQAFDLEGYAFAGKHPDDPQQWIFQRS